MKILEKEFQGRASQRGFTFTQLTREGNKAIYKKQDGELTYYEVIIIRISKEANINGNIIPEQEKYPSDNDFGSYGYCCNSYEKALCLYNNIENQIKTDDTEVNVL